MDRRTRNFDVIGREERKGEGENVVSRNQIYSETRVRQKFGCVNGSSKCPRMIISVHIPLNLVSELLSMLKGGK